MTETKLPPLSELLNKLSVKQTRVFILAGVLVLYAFFIWRLSTNPGGFYYDEACQAYNGYLIGTTGYAANGTSFPLFIQCYTEGLTQWMSPLYVYLLAGMYLFVQPSALSAHILSATLVFISIILLGILAARISGRDIIGIIVALTAMTTPWLFEVSRLAHEPTPLSLGIVLFLFCLYNAYCRKDWKLTDNILLGAALAFITYSYAAGRVLGPAFAFGLLIFAFNRRALVAVFKTWAIYVVLLIPFIVAYLTNRDAITARFREVSYITADTPLWEIAKNFVSAYFLDISPLFLLVNGDSVARHHIPVMGGLFVVTFLLAIVGSIIVLLRHRGDAWWRFILYALVISILPGALTVHRQHFLRLLALPILLLILTVPALSFLVEGTVETTSDTDSSKNSFLGIFKSWKRLRLVTLVALLVLASVQAIYFQIQFRKWEPARVVEFHKAYPEVFDKALEQPSRPIYLEDGRYGPAYILALWHGALEGVPSKDFVHLAEEEAPPPDALVLSSAPTCTNCTVLMHKSLYLLYRTTDRSEREDKAANATIVSVSGNKGGELSRPRGIAADTQGNIYVADTGNHRVQKFAPDGEFLLAFGTFGKGVGELHSPNGIVVDNEGSIYVTDAENHRLLRFGPDGEFQKEWARPDVEFYGPRDMALSPSGQIYIVDQGRSRIVKFDPATETFTSFGSSGEGDGQFREPDGIAVGGALVFVTDGGNSRIQVFDLDGNFVRKWPVSGWKDGGDSYPDCVFDGETGRLYVTREMAENVTTFDANGTPIETEDLSGNIKLNNPANIFLSKVNNKKTLIVLDITDSKFAMIPLQPGNQEK